MRLFFSVILLVLLSFIGFCTFLRVKSGFEAQARQQDERGRSFKHRKLGSGIDHLRIAVFGSDNAWGSGLTNRFKAYPFLLSPTVTNFASSAGANYFSVCTETEVGDDAMFDVIILDYWLRYDGLDELARRLRERFPHAIMILLRSWHTVMFRRKSCEIGCDDDQQLAQWKEANNLTLANLQTVINALEQDTGHWYLPSKQFADDNLAAIRENVNGHVCTFGQRETGVQTLISFLGYHDERSHAHYSELGHQAVANAITEIVDRQIAAGHDINLANTGVKGDWGRGDSCHMWYNTGGTNLIYSESLEMKQFDEHNGHFALEVKDPGWFVTKNPFVDSGLLTRTMYVSYLTSRNRTEYPDAQVSFGGQSWILPTWNTADTHHNIRTVALGQVPFGETNVTIDLDGNEEKPKPFRLVGVVYTNEIAVPMEWGFGPTHQ